MPAWAPTAACRTPKWAEQAAEAGAKALMCCPRIPTAPTDDEVVEHYRLAASVGLPIVAYNNPIDTKVDLTPQLHRPVSTAKA